MLSSVETTGLKNVRKPFCLTRQRADRRPELRRRSIPKAMLAAYVLLSGCAFAQLPNLNSGTEYSGPSILSPTQFGNRGGQAVDLRFFANVTGIYNSGETPVIVNSDGNIAQSGALWGTEVAVGVYGSKRWRHDMFGVDYTGSYAHYSQKSFYDGTNQALGLTYQHQFSRRLSLEIRETAGITSRATGLGAFGQLGTTDIIGLPANQLFDNRGSYTDTNVALIYQFSPRLFADVSGDGSAIRWRSAALVGINTETARGGISYRVSKRQTVRVGYNYLHFDYPHFFGSADIQQVNGSYSIGLDRKRVWQLGLTAGALALETKGLQIVSLSPAIAALLGQGSIIQAYYRKDTLPYGGVRLTGNFRRSVLSVGFSRDVSPGNGVYQASENTSATANFNYTGIRKWAISAGGGYNKLSSIGPQLQDSSYYNAGAGATYNFARSAHVISRLDYRRAAYGSSFQRDVLIISLGVGYSPGDIPLNLW